MKLSGPIFCLLLLAAVSNSCWRKRRSKPKPYVNIDGPRRRVIFGYRWTFKRSVHLNECEQMEVWEIMAAHYCTHGTGWMDGFTWKEVELCEDTVNSFNVTLPYEMPDKEDFDVMDKAGDNNGILTMKEWRNFVGCDDKI